MANLFIGIGGAGVKTISSLKNQLNSSNPELLEKTRFLFIDTDEAELRHIENKEKINLGDSNVMGYFAQLQNKIELSEEESRFLEWFDSKATFTMKNGPLRDGASAQRVQGRGSFAINQILIKDTLKNILSEMDLLNSGNIDENSMKFLNVYTCCSIAGGTGSAIYLDLIHLLKNEFQEIYPKGCEITICSVMYMPEFYKKFQHSTSLDIEKNAFAFCKEINAVIKDHIRFCNSGFDALNESIDALKTATLFPPISGFKHKVFNNHFYYFFYII